MSKELENKVKKYYDEMQIPEVKQEDIAMLQQKLISNRPKKKREFKLILISTICAFVVLVLSIVLPFVLKDKEKFYSDDETHQVEMQEEHFKDIINNGYSHLNFIFDECNIASVHGTYVKEKLVAINVIMSRKDIDSEIEMNLVIDKRYRYKFHETYIENAEKKEGRNYILYKKIITLDKFDSLLALIEYGKADHKNSEYKIYLNFNFADEKFLGKFLNN